MEEETRTGAFLRFQLFKPENLQSLSAQFSGFFYRYECHCGRKEDPPLSEISVFENLMQFDLGAFIQEKDSLRYVAWANAYAELQKHYPNSSYEIVRFPDEQGRLILPFLRTEVGYFVEVAVTVEGIRKSCVLPVMDEFNQALEYPNALDINNSIQRCLVKAIALHGLGLYVYAGEEFPFDPWTEPGNNDAPEGPLPNPILRDVRGEEGPGGGYYIVDLEINGEIVEVAVVSELIGVFDMLNLAPGDPCQVSYKEMSGRYVATLIQRAS
jgi:hypothetical protein